MSQDKLFAEIDKRANLAMSNEMEMLTFYLTDGQLYGLNVFKIIEIIECPQRVTKVPYAHPNIKGEINFRGKPIAIIDVSEFLGMAPTPHGKEALAYVIICEYSRTVQGFLVTQPNMLLTKRWDEIIRPEGLLFDSGYLTAITYHDDVAIQILDVEKVLSEIVGIEITVSPALIEKGKTAIRPEHHVLAVDDSKAACVLIEKALTQLGVQHTVVDSAPKALELLHAAVKAGQRDRYTVTFTDIEMPVMDGFTFLRRVKEDPLISYNYVAIHSSLSNKSNQYKAEQMGADDFIPKFTPDNIATLVLQQIEKAAQRQGA